MVILIPVGCRSDYNLTRGLRNNIKDALMIELDPSSFGTSYIKVLEALENYKVECIIITGDRWEMLAACISAFENCIPIAHLYAGVKNSFATHDDIFRHMITLMSDIQLVENQKCAKTVKRLCNAIGKKPNIHVVGITHLDEVILDYSKVPLEPYNLILYNPTTRKKEIFIGPNPDKAYDNLPQEQYLALVKMCDNFITNSSSGIYEAPFLIKKGKIHMLGSRNTMRTKKKVKLGATSKIMKVLKKIDESTDKNK